MTYAFKIIDNIRQKLAQQISHCSIEQLHQIPTGFNNNIIWNFGHLVVSGYSLAFRATGANPSFEIPFLEKYKKGSIPGTPATQEELDTLLKLSASFTDIVSQAMDQSKFDTITPYTTQTFGVPIDRMEEMIFTITLHDVMHIQVIKDYIRILNSKN